LKKEENINKVKFEQYKAGESLPSKKILRQSTAFEKCLL